MTFNTHERTPKIKNNAKLKAMLIGCYSFFGAFLIFFAIVASVTVGNIQPALIILLPFLLLAAFGVITSADMNNAHVEIDGDRITVTDYCFGVKKEQTFSVYEIKWAEIVLGSSFRVRGYRHSVAGITYIVFRNEQNRYLFKLIHYPENKEYFEKLLNLEITS